MSDPLTDPQPAPARGLKRTGARAGTVARAALKVIRFTRTSLRMMLEALLAVIIVFEEWGWKPLAALLGQLARLKSIAALEAAIQSLPPYPSLLVFALPSLLLFPLKLASLWLIANGQILLAGGLFVAAKLVGTALLARIFMLTQPRLMQLAWFARIYNTVIPWKIALVERAKATPIWQAAHAAKVRISEWFRPMILALKPRALALVAWVRGRFGRA